VVADKRDSIKKATICILPENLKPDEGFVEARNTWIDDIK